MDLFRRIAATRGAVLASAASVAAAADVGEGSRAAGMRWDFGSADAGSAETSKTCDNLL